MSSKRKYQDPEATVLDGSVQIDETQLSFGGNDYTQYSEELPPKVFDDEAT
jgi:hypothetical protein